MNDSLVDCLEKRTQLSTNQDARKARCKLSRHAKDSTVKSDEHHHANPDSGSSHE